MTEIITTEHLNAIPAAPGHDVTHSITTHMPTWARLQKFIDRDPVMMKSFKSMYPRMIMHRFIKELMGRVMGVVKTEGQMCLLFWDPNAAKGCVEYATSPARGDDVLAPDTISIRIFDIDVRLYAVLFAMPKAPIVMPFWTHTGTGISSRLAEECLKHIDLLREVSESDPAPQVPRSPAQRQVRERIATLLERAPVGPPRAAKVSPEDVYLFQTGMAGIYYTHQYLLSKFNSNSVLFGFAFHSTPYVLDLFGPGKKFFGKGTELDELEAYLKEEAAAGRKVQALWTEMPANPLISTPDLARLRELADEYKFVLIVDETIGSFCNVDVLPVADIIVTSLTKSFNGYADVMAASAVLNPSSAIYPELKALFDEKYTNYFHNKDAETLEENSRDYMARSAILNANAEKLVNYLHKLAMDPNSSVAKVYYPTFRSDSPNYRKYMRQPTEDFKPGYGGLFSVELESIEATIAFYDNLNAHCGPHLGAHRTIALPYAKGIYAAKLDEVAPFGLNPKQIRIAVGLEDGDLLVEDFKKALKFADAVKGQAVEMA